MELFYVMSCEQLPKPTKLPISNIIYYILNYISATIRPDITTYVNQFSQFLKNPTKHQYQLVLKLVSYLNSTMDLGLNYYNLPEDNKIHTYTDSSNFNAIEKKARRLTGIVIMYKQSPVHWSSRKQNVATGDICEAELYAINSGLKSACSLRNVLFDIYLINIDDCKLNLYCDNSATLLIAREGLKKNSSHYDLTLLYIQDFLDRNELILNKTGMQDNVADIMTKFVTHQVFNNHLIMLCLIIPEESQENESTDLIALNAIEH